MGKAIIIIKDLSQDEEAALLKLLGADKKKKKASKYRYFYDSTDQKEFPKDCLIRRVKVLSPVSEECMVSLRWADLPDLWDNRGGIHYLSEFTESDQFVELTTPHLMPGLAGKKGELING